MVPIVMKLKYQATVPTATVQVQPSYQFYQEISTSIGNQLQPISMIQSEKPGIFFWPQDSNDTSTRGWVTRVGSLSQYYPLTPIFYTPKDKAEELKWENAFFLSFGMPPISFKKTEESLANRCDEFSVTYIPPLLGHTVSETRDRKKALEKKCRSVQHEQNLGTRTKKKQKRNCSTAAV